MDRLMIADEGLRLSGLFQETDWKRLGFTPVWYRSRGELAAALAETGAAAVLFPIDRLAEYRTAWAACAHAPLLVAFGAEPVFLNAQLAYEERIAFYLQQSAQPLAFHVLLTMLRARLDAPPEPEADADAPPSVGQMHVERVRALVAMQLPHDLSLAEAAASIYVCPSYLSHAFRAQTGETYSSYSRRIRMEAAARLLRDTDLGVEEIAECIGFHNRKYFFRVFRSVFPCTPAAFRVQARREATT